MEHINRIALVVLTSYLLAACAPISEPWVPGDQLHDERHRSELQSKELRDHLATSQIDR